jgi:hypothetical protein
MELNAHQKLGLIVFILLGCAAMVFGAMRMGQVITGPFKKDTTLQYRTIAQQQDEAEQKLKTQDSDKDGITDYDEMRIFRTSPYLDDSDSDGILDGVEIAQSTDPNCPKGHTCREASKEDASAAPAPASGGTAVAPAVPGADVIAQAITETFGDVQTLTPEKIAVELKKMSTTDLRTFLVKIGIPAASLEKADDATLRTLLQQTMEEIATKSH